MKLTVITINFNNRDGLRKTIESVKRQTYQDFQYVVIDGGSTDGSKQVIEEYAEYIDYWVSEPDNGVYNAMNKAIDVAYGEYCNFMNSGDIFYNDSVLEEVSVKLFDASILVGDVQLTDGRVFPSPSNISLGYFYCKKDNSTRLNHQASFIKSKLLKKYYYDECYKIVSDWKFLIQTLIYDNLPYKKLDNIIAVYDLSGISTVNYQLDRIERESVLKNDFPIHVYNYCQEVNSGYENRLYNIIKDSKYHRIVYSILVLCFKIYAIAKKDSCIRNFPLIIK